MASCISFNLYWRRYNNTYTSLAFWRLKYRMMHDFQFRFLWTSAGDIMNGNKGRDGHFARTDLTGDCQNTRSSRYVPLLPLKVALPLLRTLVCVCRDTVIAYVHSWPSACPHSLFMVHVYILMFVCFTQWWKKMIHSPAVFTSPAQITTKTTVSMETVSSPTSWPSRPAGTHTHKLTHTHLGDI